MHDVIEVSYTGDLLAHRRCARAWAFEKHAGFVPHEQVQAMEGRLVHHAMEWMARTYAERSPQRHCTKEELYVQLDHYFRVLWARGIRTAFASKKDTLDRVAGNLFPNDKLHPTVKIVVEGAVHTEYELRAVRKIIPIAGKTKLMLTGVLDLVIQQSEPIKYSRAWKWADPDLESGEPVAVQLSAKPKELEIWDYKGSKASSQYLPDYVRQLLTYAALYRDRSGNLPARCVLSFLNEKERAKQLLVVESKPDVVERAVKWTIAQVGSLQQSVTAFMKSPAGLVGGPPGGEIADELKQQCTACGFRFDCKGYCDELGHSREQPHPDVDIYNVAKN
jgi:hypothetical protein